MRVKVQGGTVSHEPTSLCGTCRHATMIRGQTLDEEIVHCHASPITSMRVTFKVTSCSSYDDERLPSFMELMEQAWILQPGSKRRPAGFIRASDLRDAEFADIMQETHHRHRD